MGIGGSKDSGSEIDPLEVAQAQAQFNRINQTTPFGSLRFSGPDKSRSTITLSPEQQALLDQQQQSQLIAGQLAGARLGAGVDRGAATQTVFNRAMGLLGPQFDVQRDQLQARLANQNLPPSMARALEAETSRLGLGDARAREQAALQAVLAGGQEQSRQVAQILALAGFATPGEPTFFSPGSVTFPVQNDGQGGFSTQGTIAGAGSGAAIGTQIFPGYGTLIGAGAGGLLGSGLLGGQR